MYLDFDVVMDMDMDMDMPMPMSTMVYIKKIFVLNRPIKNYVLF